MDRSGACAFSNSNRVVGRISSSYRAFDRLLDNERRACRILRLRVDAIGSSGAGRGKAPASPVSNGNVGPCTGDAHTHAVSFAYQYADSDPDPHPRADVHADGDTHACSNEHTDSDRYAYADTDKHPGANRHFDADSLSHPYEYPVTDSYP